MMCLFVCLQLIFNSEWTDAFEHSKSVYPAFLDGYFYVLVFFDLLGFNEFFWNSDYDGAANFPGFGQTARRILTIILSYT